MYRRGIVEEVDVDTHRVRVRFPEHQDMVSGWLDVLVRDALDDKEYSLPSKGAQVGVMMDENDEAGCVLGAVYSKADAPVAPKSEDARHLTFKDGTQVKYDRAAHELAVKLAAGAKLKIDVSGGGMVEVGGSAQFLVRADKLHPKFMAHVHPTGVGPSGPPSVPISIDDIATETMKAT